MVSKAFVDISLKAAHLLPQLLRRPVINSPADLVPPHIRIGKKALVYRRRRCESEHDRSQGAQLVVHLPPLGDVLGLEGNLQTTAAHAEGHGIHVDEVVG